MVGVECSSAYLDANPERRPELPTRVHKAQPAAGREGTRRRSHRLKRDVVLALRRKDLRISVAREQLHDDSEAAPREGERCRLLEYGKAVVEVDLAELRVEPAEGLLLAGRDPALVEDRAAEAVAA